MSTVLSVYCNTAFKEYLLPAVNNANSSIVLSRNIFGLEQNLEILLEIVEHRWSFLPSEKYSLSCDNVSYFNQVIRDGDLIRLTINGENRISILVKETDRYFSVYSKFNIQKLKAPVTIGKNESCTIVFDAMGLVSREHARIKRTGQGIVLEDTSTNGTFVNNVRVNGSVYLNFGDCIDIYGLRLCFLGSYLAINTESVDIRISEGLSPCRISPETIEHSGTVEKRIFHRSPRHIAQIDTEPVEIDAPPNPKELDQPSLISMIGPSLTMALPMLLGCALMIYSSRSSGGQTSAFMFTGLITAVSSAIFGSIWAVNSAKRTRQKFERDTALRDSAYRKYLKKSEQTIAEKYKKNSMALHDRYRPADECVLYDERNPKLWNRNNRHEDFLTQRLGIGRVPFQAPIVIPKERFTLISDELMEMPKKLSEKYAYLEEVPICVDLLEDRLLGVVGGPGKKGAAIIVHDLVSQIAANNCYTDVKLLIVYDENETGLKGTWGFANWLPHVWNENKSFRYVADNKADASDVFYELAQALRIRAEENTIGRDKTEIPKPYYVLILADPNMLEGELVSKYILDPKPEYGLSTIMIVESYEELPNECTKIIENDHSFSGIYNIDDDIIARKPIRFDVINSEAVENFARKISDVEVRELETGGEIPNSLTFFDMFGISALSALNVMDRWRKNRTYDSLKAIVGFKAGGVPCYLDVHEKYHGPHGLVAGTTGSGKSETLQTYILSLAINFSPDDVGFFLIDYKGGGMAGLFSNLPHLSGQISNLSGNQIRRAMVSIKSENLRRQRIFNEYGVNNINSYTKLYKNNEAKVPVPHLFIIIDEFAELKREEPDFMRELISVAQVGRSLGVHLILATQKPGGTVDDNIWSNSKFRLCLRVQDRQDSNDMLHRPDAAYITQAGRCYMQVGNDELFELFQSGWSGAYYSEDSDQTKADIAKMISVNGRAALEGSRTKIRKKAQEKREWIAKFVEALDEVSSQLSFDAENVDDSVFIDSDLCHSIFSVLEKRKTDYPYSEYNAKRIADFTRIYYKTDKDPDAATRADMIIAEADSTHRRLPEKKERTQLDAVVDYLSDIAEANGYINNLKLWMPVLPEVLYLKDIPGAQEGVFDGVQWVSHDDAWTLSVEMGMYDDPENQSQGPLVIDQSKSGHLVVCGTVTSGKSTFLQTYIYALINRYSPSELNLYIMDFSSKMLSAFEGSSHVGGVMYENDDKRIEKFFTMIGQILKVRKEMFRGGNFGQHVRAHGKITVPSIIVVIDNYANFRGKTNGRYDDNMLELAKDGVSYGIFLAITGAGFGTSEIPSKLADNLRTTISLEMNDRFQYGEVMRMLHVPVMPEVGVKGRGLSYVGEGILEFQTALCLKADDDFKRAEAISLKCDEMNVAWKGSAARPIPEIPEKPIWSDFIALEDSKEHISSGARLPIAYEERYATTYALELQSIYTFVISGKARTGKTNMLKAIILSAREAGGKLVIFDFDQEFEALSERVGAMRITDSKGISEYFQGFLPSIKERNVFKHELLKGNAEENEIFEKMQKFEKVFFFIGNMEKFMDKVYRPDEGLQPFGAFIENILDKGYLQNYYWFGVYDTEQMGGIVGKQAWNYFIRPKRGMHFGGNVSAQRIFTFDDIPFMEQSKSLKPGYALVPASDDTPHSTLLVVPLVKG